MPLFLLFPLLGSCFLHFFILLPLIFKIHHGDLFLFFHYVLPTQLVLLIDGAKWAQGLYINLFITLIKLLLMIVSPFNGLQESQRKGSVESHL